MVSTMPLTIISHASTSTPAIVAYGIMNKAITPKTIRVIPNARNQPHISRISSRPRNNGLVDIGTSGLAAWQRNRAKRLQPVVNNEEAAICYSASFDRLSSAGYRQGTSRQRHQHASPRVEGRSLWIQCYWVMLASCPVACFP